MTRTSPAEVRGLFRRLVKAAERAGIDASGWVLEEGSSIYGRAWRLYRRDPESGGLYNVGGDSYLGKTAREASLTLSGMVRALEMVPAREGVAPPADDVLALNGPFCSSASPNGTHVCLRRANHLAPHRNGMLTW